MKLREKISKRQRDRVRVREKQVKGKEVMFERER